MTIPLVQIEEFVGNQELKTLLAGMNLPAVSLFAGPSGVGKKTLAVALAARLACLTGGPSACGSCSSCIKIQGANHPDVIVAEREWVQATMKLAKKTFNPRVTTIDVARSLVREAQYQPFEAERRFFILDEVDKLNTSASNAFLKTLEEPVPHSHFILVTAHPEKLLPTILSRCQRFNFAGLTRQEIEDHLRTKELDAPAERATFAQGSIGRALALDLEQLLADRDLMLKILSIWCQKKRFGVIFKACNSQPLVADLKDRERVLEYLDQLTQLGEDLYFLTIGQENRVVNRDKLEALQELANQIDLDWLDTFLYHVREAAQDVDRYVTPLVCFESIWLESIVANA